MLLRVPAACLVMMLAGACALVPKFQQPHLDVVDVKMLRGDLFQQELLVRMQVRNPNDRALAVRRVQYEVEVDGKAFAHGESEHNFTVPANGETQFDVSVTANAAAAVLRLLGGKRETVEYRINGKVALAAGLVRSVPFDQKGEFSLR